MAEENMSLAVHWLLCFRQPHANPPQQIEAHAIRPYHATQSMHPAPSCWHTSQQIFKIGLFNFQKCLFCRPKVPIWACKKHYFAKQPRARSMCKAARAACKQLPSEKPNRMPEPADTCHCAPHRPFTACQANKFGQHLQG